MKLEYKQIHRANMFFIFLRKQSKEYLTEQNISKCKKCEGFGLDNTKTYEGADYKYSTWDASSYCDECEGIGYIGVIGGMQIDLLHYICRNCAGFGCLTCNEGISDWIDHSMGR